MGTDFLSNFNSLKSFFLLLMVFSLCSLLFAVLLYEGVAFLFETWCGFKTNCFSDRTKVRYKIGVIERIVYIMLISIGQTYIMLGWFALKALQNPFKFQNVNEDPHEAYHIIVLGNCLSLFCGILGGIAAHIWLHSLLV